MIPKIILQDLENYANQILPTVKGVYQKYSGISFDIPQVIIKDKEGFICDHIRWNAKQKYPSLEKKISQILEQGLKLQEEDFSGWMKKLNDIAHEVILEGEGLKKLRSVKHYKDFLKIYHSIPICEWNEVIVDAELALPNESFNPEVGLSECVMFVKPTVDIQTVYILKWKGEMAEQRKPKDVVKMFLVHECCHLLNQKLGNLASLRIDKSLSFEERLAYRGVDEGSANFLEFDIFNNLYDNPELPSKVIKNKKYASRVYGIANTIMNIIYREKEMNPFKYRVQSYNFFKTVNKKYGLKEVFRIIQNPHLVSQEEIQKPRKYKPIETFY